VIRIQLAKMYLSMLIQKLSKKEKLNFPSMSLSMSYDYIILISYHKVILLLKKGFYGIYSPVTLEWGLCIAIVVHDKFLHCHDERGFTVFEA